VGQADDVETLLAGQDWAAITERLVLYARGRLGGRSVETAKEIVQEALTRLWDPAYSDWDPMKEPSLLRHLGSVVNGIVRNLNVAARERALVTRSPDALERAAERGPGAPDGRAADGRIDARKAVDRLLERTADDEIVAGIVLLMADGVDRPAEQSSAIGRPIGDVYNARRRLKDHASAVRAELGMGADDGT
jgi:DNA-directed RNA polymerase specialized sigma24 family protein